MADETTERAMSVFMTKVGPLPLWVWLAAGVAIWWYLNKRQAASTTAATGTNQQTDPAGNIGSIDPATGYVYGTPEDTAALAANNAGTSSSSTTPGTTPGQQTYTDNNAWAIAAVNYLVGLGIDATTANQAIQLYLSSQSLTTAQQGDVNLAVQALGSPPSPPGPSNGNPPPVTTPPGSGSGTVTVPKVTGLPVDSAKTAITGAGLVVGNGASATSGTVNSQTPGAGAKVAKGSKVDLGVTSSPGTGGGGGSKGPTAAVPTGLVISAKSAHSLRASWKASKNAKSYHVKCAPMGGGTAIPDQDVTGTSAVFSNLTGGKSYVVDVWAQPEAGPVGSGPHAEVSTTLPRT